MSEPFLAEIVLFAGNFAPRGWAFCQGQILSIAQNTALFSLLGTTYGGNGQTTFALPDLRGRVPIGTGQGPGLSSYNLGQVGGTETVTLNVNNLPAHNHPVNVPNTAPSPALASPVGNYLAPAARGGSPIFAAGPPNAAMGALMIGNTGGSQPFGNVQPYLAINFIIAITGIFPSRN
jgi:microcystin-dependent protein